jgi:hypothetical protein
MAAAPVGEWHWRLRVIAPGGLLRHPAARLEVKILQVIIGPLSLGRLVEHFAIIAARAPAMHLSKIGEEQARAVDQYGQRAVVVSRQRIDPRLHIGEVLAEQARHVRVHLAPVRNRAIRMRAPAHAVASGFGLLRLRQAAHEHVVSDVPGYPRQLSCTVGEASGKARNRISHARFPIQLMGSFIPIPIWGRRLALPAPVNFDGFSRRCVAGITAKAFVY